MSLLALSRPELPLFLHVLGAMVLVGAVATAGVAALTAGRSAEAGEALRRLSFRSLLFVAFPAWWVMRIGAEWMLSKEFGDLPQPGWITLGFITAEGGGLLLLIAIILSWMGSRRGSSGLTRAAGVISVLLTLAWLVTVWAMSGKP